MARFWMNTTSSSIWHGTPVGIIRVEKELSLRIKHEPFVVDGSGFKRDELRSTPILAGQINTANKDSFQRNKAHGFLVAARMYPRRARLVKGIGYLISSLYGINSGLDKTLDKSVGQIYLLIKNLYLRFSSSKKRLDIKKYVGTSNYLARTPPVNSPFSDGDIIFTCGLDWDNAILEKISILKKEIDLNLVTVIYDLIPISNPEYIQNTRHVNRLLGHFTLLAQLSTLVLVNTEATAAEFRKLCVQLDLVTPEIRIVPWGVGFDSSLEPKEVPGILPKIKNNGFLLTVGTLEIRKNYQIFVNIIKLAQEKNQAIPHFVFVGTPGWGTHELQIQIENEELLQKSITWLKSATDEQLIWLYQNCDALLSPSFGEGFGLPVAEAQFFGKKTYISDIPVYRELFPDSTFISPNDPAAWLLAITKESHSNLSSRSIPDWNTASKIVAQTIGDFFGTEMK